MTLTLHRPFDTRRWLPFFGFWAGAVVLSTAQIYLRELAHGYSPPLPAVFWANCLAWSPWLLIVPLALRLERRFPVSRPRHILLHGVVACVVSANFLSYLTLFHWVYLGGRSVAGNLAALRVAYLEKLDQFFLTAGLLYATIVVVGFASRTLRAYRTERLQASGATQPTSAPTLVIRSVGRVERVDPASVEWIEACGNYARLHIDGKPKLIRRTLASLADELNPLRFARVHRSAIVNVGRVVELRRRSHGEATLVLQGGHELKVSRTYRSALERLAR